MATARRDQVPVIAPEAVGRALELGVAQLRDARSPTPRLDAEVLLAHVTGHDRAWVLAHPDDALPTDAAARYRAAIERRAAGEPVAYIRGFKEWLSLRIRTDARALIPRPETEVLAEAAFREIERRLDLAVGGAPATPIVAWEVATGSGAVAVALARRFRSAVVQTGLRLIATDISEPAIALAAENLDEHGVADTVTLARADLLEPAGRALPRPDVVVANLPYLSTAEVESAAGSLAFEPRVALEAGADGMSLLRRLFAQLPSRAAPDATVLLEVAVDQADAVRRLATPYAAATEALPDLAGIPRVVIVRMGATAR